MIMNMFMIHDIDDDHNEILNFPIQLTAQCSDLHLNRLNKEGGEWLKS